MRFFTSQSCGFMPPADAVGCCCIGFTWFLCSSPGSWPGFLALSPQEGISWIPVSSQGTTSPRTAKICVLSAPGVLLSTTPMTAHLHPITNTIHQLQTAIVTSQIWLSLLSIRMVLIRPWVVVTIFHNYFLLWRWLPDISLLYLLIQSLCKGKLPFQIFLLCNQTTHLRSTCVVDPLLPELFYVLLPMEHASLSLQRKHSWHVTFSVCHLPCIYPPHRVNTLHTPPERHSSCKESHSLSWGMADSDYNCSHLLFASEKKQPQSS